MQQFNIGDVVRVTITDKSLYPGHVIEATITSICRQPQHDGSVFVEYRLSAEQFGLDGEARGVNKWAEYCYWSVLPDSNESFMIAYRYEDDGNCFGFKSYEATAEITGLAQEFDANDRNQYRQKLQELENQLAAAQRKIRVLEAGGLNDLVSEEG